MWESCPRCGGREFRLDTDVKPGLPGYGWADDPSHGLTVQVCTKCLTVPVRDPQTEATKSERSRIKVALDAQGRPLCPRPGCVGQLCQGEPVVEGHNGYGWNDRLLICQACGTSYHPRLLEQPEPPSQPKAVPKKFWFLPIPGRPEVPSRAFSGPVPAAPDEREIADFWRRERIQTLQLRRTPEATPRRYKINAPALAGRPETWELRVFEDIILRYRLMRGDSFELQDVYPDRGVSVEEWLGLLGARKGPAQPGGADAVRICLCAGEKKLEGKPAARRAARFLGPLEALFLKVIAQGEGPPDRKSAELLSKSAAKIGKALEEDDVKLAFREVSRVMGKVVDLPGLVVFVRLAAPFTPFITERIYRHIRPKGPVSVHLTRWPFSEY